MSSARSGGAHPFCSHPCDVAYKQVPNGRNNDEMAVVAMIVEMIVVAYTAIIMNILLFLPDGACF